MLKKHHFLLNLLLNKMRSFFIVLSLLFSVSCMQEKEELRFKQMNDCFVHSRFCMEGYYKVKEKSFSFVLNDYLKSKKTNNAGKAFDKKMMFYDSLALAFEKGQLLDSILMSMFSDIPKPYYTIPYSSYYKLSAMHEELYRNDIANRIRIYEALIYKHSIDSWTIEYWHHEPQIYSVCDSIYKSYQGEITVKLFPAYIDNRVSFPICISNRQVEYKGVWGVYNSIKKEVGSYEELGHFEVLGFGSFDTVRVPFSIEYEVKE